MNRPGLADAPTPENEAMTKFLKSPPEVRERTARHPGLC